MGLRLTPARIALIWATFAVLLQPARGKAADDRYVQTREGQKPVPRVVVQNVCAWPNLTLLADGTIVAAIFNQPSHGRDEGDVESWATVDHGKTWKRAGTAAPHEAGTNRMNVAAGRAANGDLIVLASGYGDPGTFNQLSHVWICRSKDGGQSWSVDKRAFPTLPTGDELIPFGDMVVASDGTLRAMAYDIRPNRKTRDQWTAYMLDSMDDGVTWQIRSAVGSGLNEVAPLNTGGANWLLAARTAAGTIELYGSDDDGRSWQVQEQITSKGLHPGHLLRLRDRRLLLSYGNRTNGDKGVDVRMSDDEGQTWSEPRRVCDFQGDGGYPSSVQLSGGEVLTAYYASAVASHSGYHMGVATWDPELTFQAVTLEHDTGAPVSARLLDVQKIAGDAPHSAFTDLARWRDRFYCAFREGRGHASADGRIRVLVSKEGDQWESAAVVALAGYDLRDADLSVTPDDRLMLLGGAAPRPADNQGAPTGTFVCFSEDGRQWSAPKIVIPPGRWLWRVTWHAGQAYGFSYPAHDGQGIDLLVSRDGVEWTTLARNLQQAEAPTEAQIQFDGRGNAYALLRRDAGSALLGKSSGTFAQWTWYDLNRSQVWGKDHPLGTAFNGFGGPNFAATLPGHWIGSGRMHEGGDHTALTYLDVDAGTMTKLLSLPSGGDCSYPGLVWHDDQLWVSYYSSHEGKSSIYLAQVKISPRWPAFISVCKDAGAGSYEAFPDIARMKDGRLITVFYAGYGHVSLPRPEWPLGGRISYVTSSDEGATWSPPRTVYDGPGDERDPSISQLRGGRLLVTYFVAHSPGTWLTYSDDRGASWSEPELIATDCNVSSPVRELSDGRLVLGVYVENNDGAHGGVLLSDDEGESWSHVKAIDNRGQRLDAETDVLELGDGTLYAMQRAANPAEMHWSRSSDRGATWSVSAPVGFVGHCPYLHRTADGTVLLSYRGPNVGVETWGTKLRYSNDSCRSWSDEITIDAWANGAYPSMVDLLDGSVLIVYYDDKGVGRPGGYRGSSDIRAKRFRIGAGGVQWIYPD